ncbi:hypothetical protein GETHOR_21970 [Geothrix oryzae]|uniref:Uncharacterized protein n=1 Tax=Geothrix oryzae TaxID=2927975 RepID=A0ABM8DT08_9BACT|nr:hypothetical protein [Geothrix oryzae]BDU70096.1 hypothetical protein GETHOR_21970 [Geothrix oryzae]
MTATPGKAPKKEKEKRQTPEERLEALRYNHMMYGPTAGERRPTVKKVNYGAPYLKHPKFQSLIAAFKKGTAFQFDVTDKAKLCSISTDGSHISFDGKIIFYSRPANKYEDNLLLDRTSTIHYQAYDALVHLVFAVLRSFPELEPPPLSYMGHQFHLGAETLEVGMAELGPNLLMGSYRHSKVQEKPRK